jgi:CBS domain-containing protein
MDGDGSGGRKGHSVRIRDVMDIKAARVVETASMQVAAELLVLTQASDLTVIDPAGNFIGVVSEGDLIRAIMPDFEEVVAAGGSLDEAFQIFLRAGRDLASVSIKRLIITDPIVIHPDDQLLHAATVMTAKMIRRLPVVAEGKFIGTVSRADICWALLCRPAPNG